MQLDKCQNNKRVGQKVNNVMNFPPFNLKNNTSPVNNRISIDNCQF